jgi:hypothetical protein
MINPRRFAEALLDPLISNACLALLLLRPEQKRDCR